MEEQLDFDLEAVRALAKLVKDHRLTELTVESDGYTVQLIRHMESVAITEEAAKLHPTTPEVAPEVHGVPIMAPASGVYYRFPSPNTPAFVEEGDLIEPGQVIGLIEAMKTFNDIPSPIGGKVLRVLAQNGQLVNHNDILMLIGPAEIPGEF